MSATSSRVAFGFSLPSLASLNAILDPPNAGGTDGGVKIMGMQAFRPGTSWNRYGPNKEEGARPRDCPLLIYSGIKDGGRQGGLVSQPAWIAVFSWGGGSKHEHKAHDAQSGTSSASTPGASARRIGIAAGLNFLFFGARFWRRNRGGERRRNQTGPIPDSALTCNFIEQSVAVDRLGNSCVTVFQEPVYEPHP